MTDTRSIARELREVADCLAGLAARLEEFEAAEAEAGSPDAGCLLGAKEVAERLSVPRTRVYALAREKRIGGVVRVGKQIRFERTALEEWIRQGGLGAQRILAEEE